jgi:hypothetical protein
MLKEQKANTNKKESSAVIRERIGRDSILNTTEHGGSKVAAAFLLLLKPPFTNQEQCAM